MIKLSKKLIILAAIVILILIISGCSKIDVSEGNEKIIIAEQYGLAYAPLLIAKELNIFEKNLDSEVEWVKMGNTIAIREAMLSGNLDVGFMGIPPFLIGYDNQMEWKIFMGLSECPVDLIGKDGNVLELKDIGKDAKIALPQPGSIQHILLSMGAEKYLGEANAFDDMLVTMNHQDAYNSMIGNTDIKYHFTSPPYNFEELKIDGARKILSGNDAFGGDFTFIVGVASKEFIEANSDKVKIVEKSIEEAIDIINSDREKTLDILEKSFSIDRKELESYLYDEEIEYSKEVKGIDRFSDFMNKEGYLNKTYYEDEVFFSGE